MPLDIFGAVIGAIAASFLIGIVVAIVLGYFIYRAITNLSPVVKGAITAGFVLVGLLLIVSVVGSPAGVTSLFTGIFISLFSAFFPSKEAED